MRVDYYFNGIEVSEYTKEQFYKKLMKITDKIPNNAPVKVWFEDIKNNYRANIQIGLKRKDIIGTGESKNILSSLEQALHRVDRQFQKYNETHNN
jgi:ribosome-associated translation inhibitor RaiA